MVNYWLLKQEPDGPRAYGFERMKDDGRTVWDGVHNNLALKHMKGMRRGDLAFYYHTGGQRQIVGVVTIVSGPYPNPEEDDERFIAVDVEYKRGLKRPVGLAEMRGEKKLAGWDLFRISRLSVVPVPRRIWDHVIEMSGRADDPP